MNNLPIFTYFDVPSEKIFLLTFLKIFESIGSSYLIFFCWLLFSYRGSKRFEMNRVGTIKIFFSPLILSGV
jgi:hypothetical protein